MLSAPGLFHPVRVAAYLQVRGSSVASTQETNRSGSGRGETGGGAGGHGRGGRQWQQVVQIRLDCIGGGLGVVTQSPLEGHLVLGYNLR